MRRPAARTSTGRGGEDPAPRQARRQALDAHGRHHGKKDCFRSQARGLAPRRVYSIGDAGPKGGAAASTRQADPGPGAGTRTGFTDGTGRDRGLDPSEDLDSAQEDGSWAERRPV